MLMVTRKRGDRLMLELDPQADPTLLARDLFAQGPIEIVIAQTNTSYVRLAVRAPSLVRITYGASPDTKLSL